MLQRKLGKNQSKNKTHTGFILNGIIHKSRGKKVFQEENVQLYQMLETLCEKRLRGLVIEFGHVKVISEEEWGKS